MSTNYNPNQNQIFYNKMWESLKPSSFDNTFSISVLIYEKTKRNENSSDEFKNIYNEEVPKVYRQWTIRWIAESTTDYKTKMAETIVNWLKLKGEIVNLIILDIWLNASYNQGDNYYRDYFKTNNYIIHRSYSLKGDEYIEVTKTEYINIPQLQSVKK